MSEWQPIESAPRDGSPVDLWIEGPDDTVDFYAPLAHKVKGKPLRHGRTTHWRWMQNAPNPAAWYPLGGLGYPLSPDVRATHWMPAETAAPTPTQALPDAPGEQHGEPR